MNPEKAIEAAIQVEEGWQIYRALYNHAKDLDSEGLKEFTTKLIETGALKQIKDDMFRTYTTLDISKLMEKTDQIGFIQAFIKKIFKTSYHKSALRGYAIQDIIRLFDKRTGWQRKRFLDNEQWQGLTFSLIEGKAFDGFEESKRSYRQKALSDLAKALPKNAAQLAFLSTCTDQCHRHKQTLSVVLPPASKYLGPVVLEFNAASGLFSRNNGITLTRQKKWTHLDECETLSLQNIMRQYRNKPNAIIDIIYAFEDAVDSLKAQGEPLPDDMHDALNAELTSLRNMPQVQKRMKARCTKKPKRTVVGIPSVKAA